MQVKSQSGNTIVLDNGERYVREQSLRNVALEHAVKLAVPGSKNDDVIARAKLFLTFLINSTVE